MEAFILSSIFLIGLIILGGFYYKKNHKNKEWKINNDGNNDYKISNPDQTYYEKFISKNDQRDFLDFSGGTFGI